MDRNEPEKKFFRTFVYGSLRKGEFNHERFPGFAESYRGVGVVHGAMLKPLCGGAYPGLLVSPNQDEKVIGEIYDVPEELHDYILRMELGAGYEWRPVQVHVEANKEEQPGKTVPIDCFAYFYKFPERLIQVPPVAFGDWSRRNEARTRVYVSGSTDQMGRPELVL